MAETATAIEMPALPFGLLGCMLVAAVMLDDQPGLLPRRHIVVLRRADQPESRAYSTHYMAWQEGHGWVAMYGHYDMSRDRAMTDLIKRERNYR